MKTTLKIYRNYLAEQLLILLFSHQYGANNFDITSGNISKMGALMDVPDEELLKVRKYCLELTKKGAIPLIERYCGRYVIINNIQVGWDYSTNEMPREMDIKLMRKLVGDPGIPNGQRVFFSVVLHVTMEDFADQIWREWQQTGQWQEILRQIGEPADRKAQVKLSKKQKSLLVKLLEEATSLKPYADPWKVLIPWESKRLLPGTPTGNASRTLAELQERGLIQKSVSPGGRTSHVSLTHTGVVVAERLQRQA